MFANYTAGTDGKVFSGIFDAPSLTHRNFMDCVQVPGLLLNCPLGAGGVVGRFQGADSAAPTVLIT